MHLRIGSESGLKRGLHLRADSDLDVGTELGDESDSSGDTASDLFRSGIVKEHRFRSGFRRQIQPRTGSDLVFGRDMHRRTGSGLALEGNNSYGRVASRVSEGGCIYRLLYAPLE